MRDNQAALGDLPEAIENLHLTPGSITNRRIILCPHCPDRDVMEPSTGWWDPLYQRNVREEGCGIAICSYCGSSLKRDELQILNRVAITLLLEKIDKDRKHLARLLDDPRQKPWKRHSCKQCESEKVHSMFWCAHDPVLRGTEVMGYWGVHDASNASCTDCDASDSQMLEMSNHESIDHAVKIRGEIARLEAERAEIDSWLATHGHIYGWAPPASPSSHQVKTHV